MFCPRGREGEEGHCPKNWCKDPKFRDLAKTFLSFATNLNGENENQHEEHKDGEHRERGCHWGFGKERSQWGQKRAVVLKKPEEVIILEPGKVIFIEVEV